MSRDFIGSQPGRSFKKSPNRDRVTRGTIGGLAGIRLQKVFRCFAPFLSNNANQTGSFYSGARSKRELIAGPDAGAQWTEEAYWIPETNSYSVVTISKSANWQEPIIPGATTGTNISPTRRIYQNSAIRQTIDLLGEEQEYNLLIDDFKTSFDQLQDFGDSTAAGYMRIRSYINNEDGNQNRLNTDDDFGSPIALSMPMLYGAVRQNLAFVPFSFQVELPRPSLIGQKVRVQAQPTFLWLINTATITTEGTWPPAASVIQIGCDRTPTPIPTRIYDPDWIAAKGTDLSRLTWTMLFPPVQWNQQVEVFPGVFQNRGPSAFGYPVPTCYPDIS